MKTTYKGAFLRPVCAQLENGQFKTYSNGCTACSDAKVLGQSARW